jgi:nucleoside-diphosphate-sugar epimerase
MNSLKEKRVLVTGGAGFIGSHIVDRLVGLGAKVTVLDNLVTGKRENIKDNLDKIKFIEKDLTDDAVLEEALEDIDLVCHQAALRSVPKSVERPLDYHQVNVTGTLKLFLKAKAKGIKKIVFASSSSVYGERFDFPEKEIDNPKPVSPYAASKLMGEHYAYLFSRLYGLSVVGLRYFNVFGPRQSLENRYAVVVPKFIVSLLNSKSPPIYGDGDQERDFTYIDNVVDANILSLSKDSLGGEVFNIAGGKPYSVNQLFKTIQELTAKNIKPEYSEPRPGDVRKTCADISKAKELLGWQPKINFKQGLKETVNWFKDSIES